MRRILSVLSCSIAVLLAANAVTVAQDTGPTGQVPAATAEQPSACCCTGDLSSCSCDPRWTVSAGTMILHRSKARAATLVENGTTDAELANVSDFDLGFAAGPRLELTRHFDSGWDIGVTYFSIDGWNAEKTVTDPGNLRIPLVSTSSEDRFDTASALYASRLYSTEINLKRQWNDRIRLLAGFRSVELHEVISARGLQRRSGRPFRSTDRQLSLRIPVGHGSDRIEPRPVPTRRVPQGGRLWNAHACKRPWAREPISL